MRAIRAGRWPVGIPILFLLAALIAPAAGTSVAGPVGAGAPSLDRPALGPVPYCNSTVYLTPVGNGTNLTSWEQFGPAPAAVPFDLEFYNATGSWNYTILWDDGNSTNGTFVGSGSAEQSVSLNHTYTVPALYDPSFNASSSCESAVAYAPPVFIYGAAGPNEVQVTANVTAGTVPLAVQFQVVNSTYPANATFRWEIDPPLGSGSTAQITNLPPGAPLDYTYDAPGDWGGALIVQYWNSTRVYDQVTLPEIAVAPQVLVQVATNQSTNGSSDQIEFWANVTTLAGTPYSGPGTVEWDFALFGNFTDVVVYGPTTGSPVNETFVVNYPYSPFAFPVGVAFVDPSAVVLGDNVTFVYLDGGNVTPPPPLLTVVATPGAGPAPLNVTLNVTSAYFTPANGSGGTEFNLSICVGPWNVSGPACSAFTDTVSPLQSPTVGVNFSLATPATYGATVTLTAWIPASNQSATVVDVATVLIDATGAGPSGGAPALALSGSPVNGTAPLNASVAVQASGGTAPYDLSLCIEGPLAGSGLTGPCNSTISIPSWNGSLLVIPLVFNQSGTYVVAASLVDLAGSSANQSLQFDANPVPRHASLTVSATSQLEATVPGGVEFLATIVGGDAPYQIQWAFGDGTFGAGVPGAPVDHTYAASGAYEATLTVTDARGVVQQSSVGPILVTVPSGAGASPLGSFGLGVIAGSVVVGLVSVAAIALSIRRAAEARRTRAWLSRVANEPSPPSKYP